MIKSSILGGSSLEIGDMLTTALTTRTDGKRLLPLSVKSRILTVAEEGLYPVLTTKLSDRFSYTQYPVGHPTNLNINVTETFGHAVTADGGTFYFGEGVSLKRYTGATSTESTVLSVSTGDQFNSVSCSADGVIVAAIMWDDSSQLFRLFVSVNSGVAFLEAYAGLATAVKEDQCSVYVNPQGTMIAATIPYQVSNIVYVRIDAPSVSIVPDVTTLLSANLPVASGGPHHTSFSDDGTTFVIAYIANSPAVTVVAYTEDSGATFTQRTGNPFDFTYSSNALQVNIEMDSLNSNLMLCVLSYYAENAGAYVSADKGITWRIVPPPASAIPTTSLVVANNEGWSRANYGYSFNFRGGFTALNTASDLHYLIYVSPTGEVEILDKLWDNSGATVNIFNFGFSADGLTIGVAGTTGSASYPATNGILTKGKYLPATPLYSQLKIVADAP
jgi:hypothetical protein